jgi:hypothetical protein
VSGPTEVGTTAKDGAAASIGRQNNLLDHLVGAEQERCRER